jgi:hypothetical protein
LGVSKQQSSKVYLSPEVHIGRRRYYPLRYWPAPGREEGARQTAVLSTPENESG